MRCHFFPPSFLMKGFFREEYQSAAFPNLYKMDNDIIREIKENLLNYPASRGVKGETLIILLGEILYSSDNQDLQGYIDKAREGRLYEYMKERMSMITGRDYDRSGIKDLIFFIMFSNPAERWVREDRAVQDFEYVFPTVDRVFKLIKTRDYCLLSHLLMRIESWFIIENMTRAFADHYPKIPIFTIHDNIATTEDHIDTLVGFFNFASEDILGISVPIKTEPWYIQ